MIRGWELWTVNVRTNHVHAIVSANKKPEAVLIALKGEFDSRDAGSMRMGERPTPVGVSRKQEVFVERKAIGGRNRVRSRRSGRAVI